MVEFVKEGRFEKVWQRKQQTYEKLWEGMPEPNFGESYKETPWSVKLVGGAYGTCRLGVVWATDDGDAWNRALKKFDISTEGDPEYGMMSTADDLFVEPIKEEEVEGWLEEEK
jgi:hypothetical protein